MLVDNNMQLQIEREYPTTPINWNFDYLTDIRAPEQIYIAYAIVPYPSH